MKWETVTSTIGNSVYALWNNGRKLITLGFNSSSNAARIEYMDEKRVFLIRKEGFLKNRTVLRNEYGVRIGSAGTENHQHFIEVNEERFFYTLNNDKQASITIYKQSKDQPLVVCDLDEKEKNIFTDLKNNKPVQEKAHFSLLMALCWYLFQPIPKEPALQFGL